jgi:hypothetical protein
MSVHHVCRTRTAAVPPTIRSRSEWDSLCSNRFSVRKLRVNGCAAGQDEMLLFSHGVQS